MRRAQEKDPFGRVMNEVSIIPLKESGLRSQDESL